MSISSVLIKAMEQAHVTQRELAEMTDITQSYVSQICSGKKQPTIPTLTRIGECLGVPLCAFFEENISACPPHKLNPEEEQLLLQYRSMSQKERIIINSMVKQVYSLRSMPDAAYAHR